ncbi:predicted protein [Phaeodactylum tricornutum CCAP 1055/1]|jgi:hypothetical protein|uniref:TLC domain-containing protein n=1 Tax=Phaeodactylum tricornutum (strain CCAP 1055/1) TaxID=556484 RepID=B7G6E2_PHATC|nr:predicted protein [Phaeodactylum tricornutum CCAP 1055/1]EEC45844.1 predicted protein [Phaeodactylum tricornutum CCAP 1055/1]|eukprot:XP_002182557.1 predicted protein [Phaeodactylum tricornutum CCAP 1055/1]
MSNPLFLGLYKFWSVYNGDTSFLPLYLPLLFWVVSYTYCRFVRREFHKWTLLHSFHNFGAIVLGLISLYYDNDAVFSERLSILWSMAYFLVDIVDCIVRGDVAYTVHATFCLLLGVANYTTPVCRELRMNSKAALLECSTPFLYVAKTTRHPAHFILFALAFTLCRIVWVPVLSLQLKQAGRGYTDYLQLALCGFYCLNLFWYAKILRILYDGATGKIDKKEV